MKHASPLRYPGGKGALVSLLTEIARLNQLGDREMAEPYAGGAGASLSMLYREETPEIHINDADPAIHAFWWAVVHRPTRFLQMLDKTPVSPEVWHRQHAVHQQSRTSRLDRGFAAFYLNRCNRSGIILNGSMVGGLQQTGKWKIDARFNKAGLRKRIERIADYGERIHVSGLDGLEFISRLDSQQALFLIDPPYFHKGKTLYLNALDARYHSELAELVRHLDSPWILTYDDCPEVRAMYRDWAAIRPYSLKYSAAKRRQGNELLITPRWMELPETQTSAAIDW